MKAQLYQRKRHCVLENSSFLTVHIHRDTSVPLNFELSKSGIEKNCLGIVLLRS